CNVFGKFEVSTKSTTYESRWISESSGMEVCKVTVCDTLPGDFVDLLLFGKVKIQHVKFGASLMGCNIGLVINLECTPNRG
uniref:hypothetical protein n=1 Tax=Algoriphagus sp. TaxID=1872435 RepID=UPI004047612A